MIVSLLLGKRDDSDPPADRTQRPLRNGAHVIIVRLAGLLAVAVNKRQADNAADSANFSRLGSNHGPKIIQ
jgi:hypothetical protein